MFMRFTASKLALATASTLAFCVPVYAHAENTFGFQLGGGLGDHHGDRIKKVDIAAVWDPHLNWWAIGGWHFALLGEAHAAYWHANDDDENAKLGEFGVSPVLRFEKASGWIRPYVEASVGVRMLTHARISDTYTLSSGFQFADMAGVGVKLGNHGEYQVGYRFQHLSNASIKRPNPGIDFNEIIFQYNFN